MPKAQTLKEMRNEQENSPTKFKFAMQDTAEKQSPQKTDTVGKLEKDLKNEFLNLYNKKKT